MLILAAPHMSQEEIQELDILINQAQGKLQRAIKAGEPSTSIESLRQIIENLKEKRRTERWANNSNC